MPIAQSADGVLHEFPDGTEPGVIDNAMADYARSTFGPPEAESSTIGAAIRGAERGVITNAMAAYGRATFAPPGHESSTIGAAIRGAELGVIPAAASMAGFGAGA